MRFRSLLTKLGRRTVCLALRPARRWRALHAELLENRSTPAANLIAAYAFNEGSGSTLTDLSGTGNTGTLSNAAWSTAGKFGSALSFNGTNAWVTVNDAPSLRLA